MHLNLVLTLPFFALPLLVYRKVIEKKTMYLFLTFLSLFTVFYRMTNCFYAFAVSVIIIYALIISTAIKKRRGEGEYIVLFVDEKNELCEISDGKDVFKILVEGASDIKRGEIIKIKTNYLYNFI